MANRAQQFFAPLLAPSALISWPHSASFKPHPSQQPRSLIALLGGLFTRMSGGCQLKTNDNGRWALILESVPAFPLCHSRRVFEFDGQWIHAHSTVGRKMGAPATSRLMGFPVW
ncbi:hypothetical protein FA13DRAFT_1729801 [Coprinellus micaceus]|uniref:Uncharacterized protein n=1 Tax=Coprinellus micaceus TaxID=71717 RepID=A0A4Y7TJC3_COPMI|nr:hypothetical protein FA13DRAFT_1729801 [Coprinellus micaceus]